MFDSDGESMLWIHEYGIWPSSEDRGLFDGFRKSLGIERAVEELPGHSFTKEDLGAVASLLGLVLYFCWGAVVVSPALGLLVEISHDEILTLQAKGEPERRRAAREALELMLGKRLAQGSVPPGP